MSLIGSLSGVFNRPPAEIDLSKLQETADANAAAAAGTLGGAGGAQASLQSPAAQKSFTDIMSKLVGDVDGVMKTADNEKAKVLSGQSTNLHQAMIAMQEAGVAFSMMVEVRNKLVESYQEIMRMQV